MKSPGKMSSKKKSPRTTVAHEYDAAAEEKNFNVDKYSESGRGGYLRAPIAPYNDAADSLANRQQMVLSFMHNASGKAVFFKAFIMALNETYNSDWASENVFGRVDPIKLFRSTERKITLAFKVPAATDSEAYENLGKVQNLIQMLYPTYVGMSGQSAQLLGQAPLVRLKVMNLVQRNDEVDPETATKNNFGSYATDLTPANGLLGVINNVQINHNLEASEATVIQKGPNTILPTYIDVSVDFSPIHEHAVGWDEEGNTLSENFPYGVTRGYSADEAAKAEDAAAASASGATDCSGRPTEAEIAKCKENQGTIGGAMNGSIMDSLEAATAEPLGTHFVDLPPATEQETANAAATGIQASIEAGFKLPYSGWAGGTQSVTDYLNPLDAFARRHGGAFVDPE